MWSVEPTRWLLRQRNLPSGLLSILNVPTFRVQTGGSPHYRQALRIRSAKRPAWAFRSRPLRNVRDLLKHAPVIAHGNVLKAMDYELKRWAGFARFIDDCRNCLTNAAERNLCGLALLTSSYINDELLEQFCLSRCALSCPPQTPASPLRPKTPAHVRPDRFEICRPSTAARRG